MLQRLRRRPLQRLLLLLLLRVNPLKRPPRPQLQRRFALPQIRGGRIRRGWRFSSGFFLSFSRLASLLRSRGSGGWGRGPRGRLVPTAFCGAGWGVGGGEGR